jgi:Rod binding domain-containing protein
MTTLNPLAASVDPTATVLPTSAADLAKRGQIKKTAENFEASFLSVMLGEMFKGVGEGEFSGGQGAQMFQSFMTDAMSKQMAKAGGIGLASTVQAEMLKMQGLS